MKRDEEKDRQARERGRPLWADVIAIIVLILFLLAVLVYYNVLYPVGMGPRQPVPFSHRVHVTYKHISCFMCHTGAMRSMRAGIPPMETCLLCHSHIIRTFPYILKERRDYEQNRPVVWERVNWLPEFVYFNHSMHITRGFDCSWCHGQVSQMDRVVKARNFEMGFCIGCHREHHATHDCFTCHR